LTYTLHHGDCLEVLRALPACSVDACVTDPPYGLTSAKKGGSGVASVDLESPYGRSRIGTGNGPGGFMGMKWDSDVPPVEIWREVLRVLRPGGHLLAFAGTRTQHRMAVNIEDAGFEIRDMIAWVYGSGFPKSHNLDGKWQGWGTALKPALEPITIARKPLIGTVAANVQAHGTGALNIDGCRVPHTGEKLGGGNNNVDVDRSGKHEGWQRPWMQDGNSAALAAERSRASTDRSENLGRWPANLIHDGSDEVVAAFPQAPGQSGAVGPQHGEKASVNAYGEWGPRRDFRPRGDSGSAARFFYCAKASKADRGEDNSHPTVKPTDLMAYLCRLVTPPGGTVLDPFMGSGSTGKAAMREGLQFIGVEREASYLQIARDRLARAVDLFNV